MDMVKKEAGIPPAVITDSLKADPNAYSIYRSLSPAPMVSVPTLSLSAQPIKDKDQPSQRLTLEAQTPSLFPTLTHGAEVDRLITEYLLLPSAGIDTPIQIKRYWKRVVR